MVGIPSGQCIQCVKIKLIFKISYFAIRNMVKIVKRLKMKHLSGQRLLEKMYVHSLNTGEVCYPMMHKLCTDAHTKRTLLIELRKFVRRPMVYYVDLTGLCGLIDRLLLLEGDYSGKKNPNLQCIENDEDFISNYHNYCYRVTYEEDTLDELNKRLDIAHYEIRKKLKEIKAK